MSNSEAQTAIETPGAGATQYALEIVNVSKHFDDVAAVNQVSVAIKKGEIFALLGGSGCGKTTLLRMLAGFETPTAGDIKINGVSVLHSPPYQRPVNMMFQSYALFPHMTVEQNVAFGLKQDKMPKAEIEARITEVLELVQMTRFRRRKPAQLSGGQQQRVALARSLAKKPALLLLDEPMGALDKKLRMQMQLELANIIESVGVTCVMVTHDQEEAMTMADRIAIMDQGQIMQVGAPRQIYEFPNSKLTAEFIGSINLFEAVAHVEADAVGGGLVPCQLECAELPCTVVCTETDTRFAGPCYVALRPEKISLETTLEPVSSNWISGKIDDIAYLGSHNVVHVRIETGAGKTKIVQVHVSNFARHAKTLDFEQVVALSWEPEAVVLIKAEAP
jgi:putrescine transport system ATP-binding protein